jgi:UPF0755 protein
VSVGEDVRPDAPPPLPSSPRPRRGRHTLAVVLAFLAVPLGLVVLGAGWVLWQLDPPGGAGREVVVEVEKGWGVGDIADELDRRGVVGSSAVFQAYAQLTGHRTIQAGRYTLARRLGVRAALRRLEAGPTITYRRLAVVPGLWLDEVAAAVHRDVPRLSARRFLAAATAGTVRSAFEPEGVGTLEGLLWPDTYQIAESERERDVLRSMVRQFDREARAVGLEGAAVEGLSPYQIVVVASLVQQEAKVAADRPLIASVIYNRLRAGMNLQVDATFLYCARDRRPPSVTAARATDCPHNTYLHAGLPPTPIGGVTRSSLEAALHPAATDYLYYVLSDRSGAHAFARTYEEHLRNVARARAEGIL